MTDEHTERYCLACEKLGHLTNECHSTHGLNTPRDRELFRLVGLAAAERERLRGYFRDALADKGIMWPGEVDILYDKCFAEPLVLDGA